MAADDMGPRAGRRARGAGPPAFGFESFRTGNTRSEETPVSFAGLGEVRWATNLSEASRK